MNPRHVFFITTTVMLAACTTVSAQSTSPWTKFVPVDSQPEPVPAQWVATLEGKFAHSIKIPNPVPKDSGYKPGMSSKEYFEHLCKTEAGEFIYKTVDNVEGFYFMRPPKRPTDAQLKDRYALEAPEIERTYQLLKASPDERGKIFINPPWNNYLFIEEPGVTGDSKKMYYRVSGYRQRVSPMKVESVRELKSRYGMIWRGIRRPKDREFGIAGGEWIFVDLQNSEVLAVVRNYGLTGKLRYEPEKVWWLSAVSCSAFAKKSKYPTGENIYGFSTSVLRPVLGELK